MQVSVRWLTIAFVGVVACGYPRLPAIEGGPSDASDMDAQGGDAPIDGSSGGQNRPCADGTIEQVFAKGMAGCAGAVTFANRATLCGPGYQPAAAWQWAANHGASVPTHHYWTDDSLKFNGNGSSDCFASITMGTDCGAATPMHVCTPVGDDAEGNHCSGTHCGLNATTPDQFFGGCGNPTAGTICIPTGGTAGTVFNTRYPVTELHSTQGGSTSGPFAAAAMMGVQGYSNMAPPSGWENTITSMCSARTGMSLWPSACNPTGMATVLTTVSSSSWLVQAWSDQASALNEAVASLQFYKSPLLVPIYGQADHWVTITQIAASITSGVATVSTVKFYDGGPPSGIDSSGNAYVAGVQAYSGSVWRNVLYPQLMNINPSCDAVGCTSDPYYRRFALLYDPPSDRPHPPVTAVFAKAPGIVPAGRHAMTGQRAQLDVWAALRSAGLDQDAEIWAAIRDAVPGPARLINAAPAPGLRWDHYRVPLLSNVSTVVAFVELSIDDGSFEGIQVVSRRQ